jgi:phage gpG-like protein
MASLVDLSQWLSELSSRIQPQRTELQIAAENQASRIKSRTQLGVSVDLQVFTAYSKATNKPSPVNLKQTGDMLSSISVDANDDQARIYFDDPKQASIAGFHNSGTKKIPQRYFFGASLNDREEIVKDIRAALFRRINK